MSLLSQVIVVASGEVGVREDPPKSNRGPRVDEYLRAVGLDPGAGHYSWCQAFTFWVFARAAEAAMVDNPCVKTAGVMKHWLTSPPAMRIGVWHPGAVVDEPERVVPGAVFIIDHGGGHGHTGIVEGIDWPSRTFATIEGNTDASGSREGDGVYRRTRTLDNPQLVGFIVYV